MDEAKIQELLGETKWCVEEILCAGNYGSVVKAREILTNMHYALKVVKYSSEEQIKYRTRELGLLAQIASQLNANVIQYYHAWPKDNQEFLCIKMELCYLGLENFMKMNNREATSADGSQGISIVKDPNFYKFVFPQILNGLDAIHSMKPKWVHRDISLANILVQNPIPKSIRQIKIKIGHFGLARQLPAPSIHLSNAEKLDEIRPEFGRGLYRAPEMSGEIYSEKVDLYSAGIVLYLLSSYPQNEKQWPSHEIEALREGRRDESNLCHDDKVLAELLFSDTSSLLHQNPEKRPSAKETLCKLPLQENICAGDGDKESEISFQTTIRLLPKNLTLVDDSLGKGSYSRAISVRHGTDNQLYAVKIIWRKDVPQKYQKRELEILTKQVGSAAIQNNIVRYYDSCEQEFNGQTILYIRMELCDTSLTTVLHERPQIVYHEMFRKHVFMQLLRALQYIHGIGFVHRDVYPSNILVNNHNEVKVAAWVVKLADFGLARQLEQSSQSISDQPIKDMSSSVGNFYYRAPEISSKKYGTKVDIYSVGVVLYRLCCFLDNDEKIAAALNKLKEEKMADRNLMCVSDERLYNLLNDLVKPNPEERPDAEKAEENFLNYIRSKDEVPRLSRLLGSLRLSLDEADGESERPNQWPARRTQPDEREDDENDDFKDGLC